MARAVGLFDRGRFLVVTGMDGKSTFDLDRFEAQSRSRCKCDPSAVSTFFRSEPLSTRNSVVHN